METIGTILGGISFAPNGTIIVLRINTGVKFARISGPQAEIDLYDYITLPFVGGKRVHPTLRLIMFAHKHLLKMLPDGSFLAISHIEGVDGEMLEIAPFLKQLFPKPEPPKDPLDAPPPSPNPVEELVVKGEGDQLLQETEEQHDHPARLRVAQTTTGAAAPTDETWDKVREIHFEPHKVPSS